VLGDLFVAVKQVEVDERFMHLARNKRLNNLPEVLRIVLSNEQMELVTRVRTEVSVLLVCG